MQTSRRGQAPAPGVSAAGRATACHPAAVRGQVTPARLGMPACSCGVALGCVAPMVVGARPHGRFGGWNVGQPHRAVDVGSWQHRGGPRWPKRHVGLQSCGCHRRSSESGAGLFDPPEHRALARLAPGVRYPTDPTSDGAPSAPACGDSGRSMHSALIPGIRAAGHALCHYIPTGCATDREQTGGASAAVQHAPPLLSVFQARLAIPARPSRDGWQHRPGAELRMLHVPPTRCDEERSLGWH